MTPMYGSLIAAALSAALSLFGFSAQAGVVFGNLGASGTASLGGTNTDYGPSDTDEILISQGFNTGTSSLLDVQSISIGLFFDSGTTASRTVSIYSSVSGTPGTALYTSQAVNVGNTGRYDFAFTGVTLSPSTNYWVVASGPASWYTVPGNILALPTAQNGSGYSAVDALVLSATSSLWESSQIKSYSVSIQAVPEPPAVVLSGIGLASALYALRRRWA